MDIKPELVSVVETRQTQLRPMTHDTAANIIRECLWKIAGEDVERRSSYHFLQVDPKIRPKQREQLLKVFVESLPKNTLT